MGFLAGVFGITTTKGSSSGSNNTTPLRTLPQSSARSATRTDQVGIQDKFEFLRELTRNEKHGHKSFYQHLYNVYKYLKHLNAPQEVCDAGLFHSIYGTEFYHFQNNRITREVVRDLIGDYAEELVHIFCTTKDRFNSIVNNTMRVSNEMSMHLCYIEFANAWDQNQTGCYDKQLQILNDTFLQLQSVVAKV